MPGYRTQRSNRADSSRISDVWRSPSLLGTVLGLRSTNQSKTDCQSDEKIWSKSLDLQGFQDFYDRFKAQQANLPELARWKSCVSAESDMGIGYHVCARQNVLCIFGCDSGRVFQKGRRVGYLKKDQRPSLFGGSQNGH